MSSVVSKKSSFDGTGVEILGDISAGYIINVVREEGEEAVRIPPSISMKLKLHQVWISNVTIYLAIVFMYF